MCPTERISLVGLGKLGACMAACFAAKQFPTVGVDIEPEKLRRFNDGVPPIREPGLAAAMAAGRTHLRATGDYREAIGDSSVTFVVVPTPSESDGRFSLRTVCDACRDIGRALHGKSTYHVIVLASTVLPGSSEGTLIPLIERESGKLCNRDFGFCYNPAFVALGTVIRDFLNPDLILIGESDVRAGDKLAEILVRMCDNAAPVARMSLVNAELTKTAVNAYVTMKISFANTLASLCERIPGADVDVVTEAAGLDKRIGAGYLKGGLGYGGPCFPRDVVAFATFARSIGRPAILAEATDAFNRSVIARLAESVRSLVTETATIAVLGIAYKPGTGVVEGAQALDLADRLAAAGMRVIVYDPLAMDGARAALLDRVGYAGSLPDALRQANAIVVATPDPEFVHIGEGDLCVRPGTVVFDPWRILRQSLQYDGEITYRASGLGGRETAGHSG